VTMHDGDILVTTVDDALIRNDEMLVLVDSEVMLLSVVSTEIARVCAGGLTLGELGDHLFSVFGPPLDGSRVGERTRVLVAELVEAGILRVASAPQDM